MAYLRPYSLYTEWLEQAQVHTSLQEMLPMGSILQITTCRIWLTDKTCNLSYWKWPKVFKRYMTMSFFKCRCACKIIATRHHFTNDFLDLIYKKVLNIFWKWLMCISTVLFRKWQWRHRFKHLLELLKYFTCVTVFKLCLMVFSPNRSQCFLVGTAGILEDLTMHLKLGRHPHTLLTSEFLFHLMEIVLVPRGVRSWKKMSVSSTGRVCPGVCVTLNHRVGQVHPSLQG